jgi:hypothetical protein
MIYRKWTMQDGAWKDAEGRSVPEAPLLDASRGPCDKVPLVVAEEAWKEYSDQGYGRQSLTQMNQCGGFSAAEIMTLLYDRCLRLQQQLSSG